MSKKELEESFLDLSADGADIALSLVTDNELLEDIPFVGTILKIWKVGYSIPDVIFLNKVGKFIKTVNEKTTEEERLKFANRLKENKKDRETLYNGIFLKLDKFDDITKADIFAKIFACFIRNRIRKEEFNALSSALNVAPLEDLLSFSKAYWKNREESGNEAGADHKFLTKRVYSTLLSTGFVNFTTFKDVNFGQNFERISERVKIQYRVTELGYLYLYVVDDLDKDFCSKSDPEFNSRRSSFFIYGNDREENPSEYIQYKFFKTDC